MIYPISKTFAVMNIFQLLNSKTPKHHTNTEPTEKRTRHKEELKTLLARKENEWCGMIAVYKIIEFRMKRIWATTIKNETDAVYSVFEGPSMTNFNDSNYALILFILFQLNDIQRIIVSWMNLANHIYPIMSEVGWNIPL